MAVEFILQPYLLSGTAKNGMWEPRWTVDAILDDGSRYSSRTRSYSSIILGEAALPTLDASREKFDDEFLWIKILNGPYRFTVSDNINPFPSARSGDGIEGIGQIIYRVYANDDENKKVFRTIAFGSKEEASGLAVAFEWRGDTCNKDQIWEKI